MEQTEDKENKHFYNLNLLKISKYIYLKVYFTYLVYLRIFITFLVHCIFLHIVSVEEIHVD